jgi:hypothetical protein
MNKRDRNLARELTKLVVVGFFCVLVIGMVVGCSGTPRITHDQCNATKFPTAHEHEQCLLAASKYEQEKHEREDKRLIRRDKLIQHLNACHAHPTYVVMEVKRGGRGCLPNKREKQRAVREHGYPYTHENVRKCANNINSVCVDPSEVLRQLSY